jgi:hypothetical protein
MFHLQTNVLSAFLTLNLVFYNHDLINKIPRALSLVVFCRQVWTLASSTDFKSVDFAEEFNKTVFNTYQSLSKYNKKPSHKRYLTNLKKKDFMLN